MSMISKFSHAKYFLVLILCALKIGAQTSSFTYQGGLTDGAVNGDGRYDFTFRLFDTLIIGNQIGTDLVFDDVVVTNGNFKVQLDFGTSAFTPGATRFLEILVRPGNSTGAFTLLNPRQQIMSSPFAIKSVNASTANNAALFGGQPPSAYGTSAQITALQTQISQLQSELVTTTGGTQLWSKTIGGPSSELGNSIAVDGNGDVLVTGYFNGTVNFGGGNLVSAGNDDIFVAKYSGTTGAYIWARRFGSTATDQGDSIAVDSAGDVFVTGQFQGTIDFGGPPLASAGNSDIFLVKLSGTDGSHGWARRFGSTGIDLGNAVAVDSAGNATISGVFALTVDFGGVPVASAGGNDIFVAKYNGTTSSHIWSKGFGGTGAESGEGVAADSNGNVFVTGNFSSSSITFGGSALTNAGNTDAFLTKLAAADGSHVWSKRFGGSNADVGTSVGIDGSGSVFSAGVFASATIDLGGGPQANSGSTDVFLGKFNNGGTHQWSKAYGGGGADFCTGVAVGNAGDLLITGNFFATTNFGGVSLNNSGDADIIVAKYAGSDGAHQWSRRFGNADRDFSRSVMVDSAGNALITGDYSSSTLDFGGGPLTNTGGTNSADIFIAKLKR